MATGSCWCGALQYTYTGTPAVTALCHCLTYRKVSGSSNTINLAIPTQNFQVTAGTPRKFAKEHESGMTLTIFFCSTCGSTIYKEGTASQFEGVVLVQAGTLHAETMDSPGAELYVSERAAWLKPVGDAAQVLDFERPVPGADTKS